MEAGKPATLKAVPPGPSQRKRYRDMLGLLIEAHGRLREYLGTRRRTEWSISSAMDLLLALAIVPQPGRLAAIPLILGTGALATVVLRVLFYIYIWHTRIASPLGGCGQGRDLILLAMLVAMSVWLSRGFELFGQALLSNWQGSAQVMAFASPLAAAPLLATIFLRPQSGLLMALGGGLLSSLIWHDGVGAFAYYITTGLVAAHYMQGGRTRAALRSAWSSSAGWR